MLSRKEQAKQGLPFPQSWTEEVEKLLNSTYHKSIPNQNLTFEVYGFSYLDEILMVTSLIHKEDTRALPISVFISVDSIEGVKEKTILNQLIDITGHVFDELIPKLTQTDEELYMPAWETYLKGKTEYFLKITRENVKLTLEADRLLNQ